MHARGFEVSDLVVVGGVVLLLASFLPWYGLDAGIFVTDGGEGGPSVTAWQASSAWWLAVLTGAGSAAAWAAQRTQVTEARWLPTVSVVAGLVGLVLVLSPWLVGVPTTDFGWFAYAPDSGMPADLRTGPRIGLALAIAGLVVQTAAAATVLRHRASD